MSLNQNFLVKNSINTLGQYLSSGKDISTLLSPYVTYTIVSQNSASWGNGGGLYTTFQNQSANNISVYSSVLATSGNWNNVYSSVNSNSSNWNNVYTSVNNTSGNWNNVYSSVNNTSANWNNVYTSVNNTSGNWNSVYSLINSTTGTNFNVNDLTVNGNLKLSGTLFLQGSAVYENTNSLTVESPIIYLAEQNPSDNLDIGIVGHNVVGGVYSHTGLLRTHGVGNPGTWYLFSSMSTEPSANSVATNSKVIDTLVANTSGSHTGNATTATTLQTSRNFSLGSGDVTSPNISFDGSSAVAFVTTIQPNVVTYSKIQQVGANKILGNSSGSTANVSEIPASTTGFALLNASSAATGATTLGLGTTDSVTHNDVTVGSTTKSNLQVYTGSVTSNNTLTIPTFSKSGSYKTGKYTVQVKNTYTSARAALEILVTYNGAAASWDGTFYGIIDSSNIFSNVDVSTSGSTVDLVFTFNGNSNYSVTVLSQALTD
jgi:hypothetical protein